MTKITKQCWFDTLNEALESEDLVDHWPLGKNINYGETVDAVSVYGGIYISVYRDENGRYERPIHYTTQMKGGLA